MLNLVLLLFTLNWFTPEESKWAEEHVGVYLCPRSRGFEGFALHELTGISKELGVRVIRVFLDAFKSPNCGFIELASSPSYRELFENFDVIILTLSDRSGRMYDPSWTEELYYRFTKFLLRTYEGTGKTFVLGLWECDHWGDRILSEEGLNFFLARKRGIERAREEVKGNDVKAVEMIEVNWRWSTCISSVCFELKLDASCAPFPSGAERLIYTDEGEFEGLRGVLELELEER